jgi:dihydroxyacetone kinase-like predicted kinase
VGTEEQGAPARASTLEYEVQYLLEGSDHDVPPLREALATLGESVVVVGGGGLFNVHVHTDDPDPVIGAGERAGLLRDVSVVSLAHQVEACLAGQARAVRVAEETSLVALADGDGVVRALESLGALVMRADSGIKPSVERLLGAIDTVPADSVIVLPNHPNAVATAERAAVESVKHVVVVPTRSIAAGLSAAAAFNPVVDAEENLRTLKEVLAASRSGEVYRSEGDGGMSSGTGDWIGVADEEVVYMGPSIEEAAIAVTGRLVDRDAELLTLIIGAARPPDEQAVGDAIGRTHPDLRIEVLAGRQQRQAFLIGVE